MSKCAQSEIFLCSFCKTLQVSWLVESQRALESQNTELKWCLLSQQLKYQRSHVYLEGRLELEIMECVEEPIVLVSYTCFHLEEYQSWEEIRLPKF